MNGFWDDADEQDNDVQAKQMLELEPKDAFVGAMVGAFTLMPDYVPEDHLRLAQYVVAIVFYAAYQLAFRR